MLRGCCCSLDVINNWKQRANSKINIRYKTLVCASHLYTFRGEKSIWQKNLLWPSSKHIKLETRVDNGDWMEFVLPSIIRSSDDNSNFHAYAFVFISPLYLNMLAYPIMMISTRGATSTTSLWPCNNPERNLWILWGCICKWLSRSDWVWLMEWNADEIWVREGVCSNPEPLLDVTQLDSSPFAYETKRL